ncbi:hypothetical protein yc1106_08103 [Curvularia clavata]|uniref:Uncharacterized protein n=1 Tax=Curvularia clavata TaxID=95742 RepID=A0A9Q9DWF0_CURCL|nr:hypothetical protein yc1106_08103 [Curvularia clavata]
MKFSALALVFLPIAAQACATYQYCHCYDSNGVPNDRVTEAVCRGLGSNGAMVNPGPKSDGARECQGQGDYRHSNCSWRQWCQLAGATGSDSSCRAKQT